MPAVLTADRDVGFACCMFPTCGSVVKVLVDKLGGMGVSNGIMASFCGGAQTYVVGRFSDVAESWWGEFRNDLLNLDVFSHDGGCGRIKRLFG